MLQNAPWHVGRIASVHCSTYTEKSTATLNSQLQLSTPTANFNSNSPDSKSNLSFYTPKRFSQDACAIFFSTGVAQPRAFWLHRVDLEIFLLEISQQGSWHSSWPFCFRFVLFLPSSYCVYLCLNLRAPRNMTLDSCQHVLMSASEDVALRLIVKTNVLLTNSSLLVELKI